MTTGPLRRLLGLARRAADPTDDAGLLARFAAAGDADAFELLVWRHGGMVLGVCRRVLGDEHAAEDAFQATFLALARQAKSVRRDGCVAGWLHRVARRVARRAKAIGERRASARRAYERLPRRADARRSPDDPLAAAERCELSQLLDEELDRLPERFRRPVVLCYLEGHTAAEAAERLGCPRGTVLSRLATAREKLRQRLLRRGIASTILTGAEISPPVIDGGLIRSTARAVVGNAASPPVIDLCDGVLRAMILSKLKLTAAVVMTVGLFGGGAGWVALAPGGPGVAFAGPQEKSDSTKPDATGQRLPPEEQNARQDDERKKAELRARRELEDAMETLNLREREWSQERTKVRLQFAEAEDRYLRLKHALIAPPATSREEEETQRWRAYLDSMRNKAVGGDNAPEAQRAQKKLTEAEANLKAAQDRLERERAESEEKFRRALREMVSAEEQLSLLDRLTAQHRRVAQARVDDLQDQLAHLRDGGRNNPTDRKVQNLDRKLDDVLHELTELRRELKK